MNDGDLVYQDEPEGQSSLPVLPDGQADLDRPRRCTGHKTNGEECPNFAVRGDLNQKCHAHGGLSAGRPVVNALYSRNIPERLRERYEELVNAPDYVSLRNQIGTITLRLDELWQRMSERDSAQRRVEILDEMEALTRSVNSRLAAVDTLADLDEFDPEDEQRAALAFCLKNITETAELIRRSVARVQATALDQRREDEVWDDLDRFSESLRKLKETEVKRMVAANQVLTVTESYNLIQRLVSFVEINLAPDAVSLALKNGSLETLRAKAIRELYSLLDRKGSKQ